MKERQNQINESHSVLSSQSNIMRYDNPKANEVLNKNQRLQEYFSLKNPSIHQASKEFDLLNDLTDQPMSPQPKSSSIMKRRLDRQ